MVLQESLRAVELATRVLVMPDDDNQTKRLREIEFAPGARAKSLAKRRKSDTLNATEISVLNAFPQYGIELSDEHGDIIPHRMISLALTFSRHLCRKSLAEHKAIIQLIRLRYLLICTGIDTTTGERREFIVKARN